MSEALEFLKGFFPSGPWTVIADRESVGRGAWLCRQFLPSEEADLEAFVEEHEGKDNLYFAVNLPRLGIATSPDAEDITHLLDVPLDVDLPAGHSQEALDELVQRVRMVNPPPTAIVFSGGGVQAHWCLKEPKPLSFAPAVAEQVLTLARELGGDHVQNPNRLMRLPGTTNVLNKKKRALGRQPARAYVIEADWSRRYEPSGAYEVPNARPPRTLAELEPEWQERVKTGSVAWLRGKDRSRSAAVWALVTHLVRSEWDDDSVIALLLDRELGASIHVYQQSNPERYARRQVRNARLATQHDFVRAKNKTIVPTRMDNVKKALAQLNVSMLFDEFAGKLLWVNGEDRGAQLLDDYSVNYLRLQILDKMDFQPSKDVMFDTCAVLGRDSKFNPIKEYLEPLTWDGIPRLETWLIRHGGAEDNLYVRAVSKIILVAAVTRVYRPGVKFDEMVILENPTQGTDKSSAIRALCPNEDWFSDSLTLNTAGRETIENLAGKWIVEVSELSGMKQRDVEHLKAFMSRPTDAGRLAYDRAQSERHRTCVFFGTTNSTRYLRDEQNRRFWPIAVKRMDVQAILAERDQFWAEALQAFRDHFSIRLPRELWELASFEQESRRLDDPWIEDIAKALKGQEGKILGSELFKALGLHRNPMARGQDANYRVGNAMRILGWERTKIRWEGGTPWGYVKGPHPRPMLYARFDPVTNETEIVELPILPEDEPQPKQPLPQNNDVPF